MTHVHLLPVFDFGFTDEYRHSPQYNWGYDPVNFNVPEGSYSTDPADGSVRINQMKQMVKSLHDAGLSVIMDVVYNHVYDGEDFCFNRIVPGYFSRISPDGVYSNGSFCGNDTASERSMVLAHIQQLGVTHVHLLPVFDFGFTDEYRHSPQYNWGYDPVNFNVPEGSYATDAADGSVRINQMKQMVKSLHDAGLSVIMDVVYNHVYDAEDFCFNRIVPGYFSRISPDGVYSNGSFCGNDTASERSMVRKYIVDSLCYWANEYHIDGFRFDLVGLLDIPTMQAAMTAVHKMRPSVLFYGFSL